MVEANPKTRPSNKGMPSSMPAAKNIPQSLTNKPKIEPLVQSSDVNEEHKDVYAPKGMTRPSAMFAASVFVSHKQPNLLNQMPNNVFESELYNPTLVKER